MCCHLSDREPREDMYKTQQRKLLEEGSVAFESSPKAHGEDEEPFPTC